MSHIRIIWFSHRDVGHPRSGGVEKTIFEVGKRLVKSGNELKWFSVKADSLPSSEIYSGIRVIRLPTNVSAHILVPTILKRQDYDVVVDDMGHAVPWGSENFYKTKGTVFFHHLHRRSLKGQVSPLFRFLISGVETLYPFIYRNWTFVTESNSSLDDLVSMGIKREKIVKILPGLNQDNFWEFDKTEHPSIVYFGGLRDYKRPWEIVLILKDLLKVRRDIHLYLVGTGPALEKVKQISRKNRITENITFTGRLSEMDLKKVVGRAWVNIHSSVTEGFGFSIIEASALGTPTVAYDVPGVNEAVENGKNGILCSDGDREEMLQAIFKIIDGSANEWTANSIQTVRKYSWDETARRWENHLYGLCH